MAFGLNPYRLNQRLSIQQGIFLCPGDISSSFVENLAALGPAGGNLIKCVITLDGPAYQSAIQKLMRMNMTRTTLFPGLDGFALSQKMALASPEVLVPHAQYPE